MLERHSDIQVINVDKLTYAGNPANLKPLEGSGNGRRYVFEKADIADNEGIRRILETHRPDAVINFAAESHVDRSINDPSPFITTNVMGVQNLLWLSKELKIERFVHVSTDEVYGSLGPDDPPFTEDNRLAPNSPYSASKASADLLVRAFHETYGFPAIVTRCSNNYGPYQFPEKLIPLMYIRAITDENLPVYGDGLNIRDWIYVLDHCRGVELALEKGRPGAIYNFGGNAELTNLDVVRTVLSALGKPEDLISFVKDRPGHDRRYAMNYSLARRDLGFKPEYSFADGMDETIKWYADNDHWLKQVQSGEYRAFMDDWYAERA